MRITGGQARGRLLRAPRGDRVRPTADKVRAAIFNILEARYGIAGKSILDLFAGSGALGLDALSRGAGRAVFVDQAAPSCDAIRANVERSGFRGSAEVVRAGLPRALRRVAAHGPFGGVFVDPPYRQGLSQRVLEALGDGVLLEPDVWVVVEHARGEAIAERYGRLRRVDVRAYGQTEISIFLMEPE